MLLTIFTPAYNRVNLLPRLYSSLVQQKTQNFEWIVVDDGSTDNTKEVVEHFIAENKIPIRYIQKENEGKHIAINKGVELAQGGLFFIVDSDDYLMQDATKLIMEHYPLIKDRKDLAGVSFRRGETETKYIGTQRAFDNFEATALEFKYKSKIIGDLAEVFKTDVLRKYPFPKIEGEKFCPEGLVWNRIALKYKLLWTSKIIYIGEYLSGGLTDNSFKIRKNSPIATTTYYVELSKAPIALSKKIRAVVNYWRYSFYLKSSFSEKWNRVNSCISIFAIPFGIILFLKTKTSN